MKSATAARDAQGRITVSANLECALVYGQPSASGCDADNTDVCLRAAWFAATDTGFQHPLSHARACAHQSAIIGARMAVTSDGPIPQPPPMKIAVQTELTLDARDSAPPAVIVDSP